MNGLPEKNVCESAPSAIPPTGTYREIPLTRGMVAIVDESDYEMVNKFKWSTSYHKHTCYAVRSIRINHKNVTIRMHSFILGTPKGVKTDHKDHNGLHNWRANLRICTNAENVHNQKAQSKNKTSPFKGVHWVKSRNVWCAQIRMDGRRIHLGMFMSEIQAALAYDEAAQKYFGEFACTNFIEV